MSFKIVIPARYSSGRLPGKPLVDLNGKPMIQRVYERACKSDASEVIIATDDERICSAVRQFGAEVCMTNQYHPSGTDRVHEVSQKYGFASDDLIVNVQGDEPFIPPAVINQVAKTLQMAPADTAVATLSCPVAHISDIFDPAVVKVVTDKNGMALYFSRAPLPWNRDSFAESPDIMPMNWVYHRHIGIYAYRSRDLDDFVKWGASPLEMTEHLEQLRFLWYGRKILVEHAVQIPPAGIDTHEDLKAARTHLEQYQPEEL